MSDAVVAAGAIVAAMSAARELARRRRPPPRVPLAAFQPVEAAAPAWLAHMVDAAVLPWPAHIVWRRWCAAAFALVVAATALGGLWLGIVVTACSVLAPGAVLHALRHRAEDRIDAAVPELLEAVARSLRTGASLPVALADAATHCAALAGDVRELVHSADRVGLVAALDRWPERRPHPGVRLAAATLAFAASTGGAAARAVDGTALTLRARCDAAAEVSALSAQARLSGWFIAVTPLGFGVVSAALDPRTAQFLFRTGAGAVVLGTALLLDGVGAAWMHHLTRTAR